MKKSVFLFAMIFAVSMAMGQNSSTVTQTGTDHNAVVTQDGDLNESVINQDQRWNVDLEKGSDADVYQEGDDNTVDFNQGGWNMIAEIDQVGDENMAKLNQSNGGNEAYVEQTGDNNTLKGYATNNETAFQKSGSSSGGDEGVLYLTQIGNSNTAGLWQEHGADANISQEGSSNISNVYQIGSAFPSSDNSAVVDIFGNSNSTDINQVHEGAGNSAVINIGSYESNFNNVDIDQSGNSNDASFGLQNGDNNLVTIDQDGDNNYTELFVKYGDDNELTELVDGDANRTRFHVNTAWGEMSSENELYISKTGDGNYVAGSIEGSENEVDIIQSGSGNMVGTSWHTGDGVSIVGSMNDVDISQTGMGNSSLNSITGNSNVIDVTQSN